MKNIPVSSFLPQFFHFLRESDMSFPLEQIGFKHAAPIGVWKLPFLYQSLFSTSIELEMP